MDVESLSAEQRALAEMLLDEGQEHIFAGWRRRDDERLRRFFDQVSELHQRLDGGIPGYLKKARELLSGESGSHEWTRIEVRKDPARSETNR